MWLFSSCAHCIPLVDQCTCCVKRMSILWAASGGRAHLSPSVKAHVGWLMLPASSLSINAVCVCMSQFGLNYEWMATGASFLYSLHVKLAGNMTPLQIPASASVNISRWGLQANDGKSQVRVKASKDRLNYCLAFPAHSSWLTGWITPDFVLIPLKSRLSILTMVSPSCSGPISNYLVSWGSFLTATAYIEVVKRIL